MSVPTFPLRVAAALLLALGLSACAPVLGGGSTSGQVDDPVFSPGQLWEMTYPDGSNSRFDVGPRNPAVTWAAAYPVDISFRAGLTAQFLYFKPDNGIYHISITSDAGQQECTAYFHAPVVRDTYTGYLDTKSPAQVKAVSETSKQVISQEYYDVLVVDKNTENYNGLHKCTIKKVKQ